MVFNGKARRWEGVIENESNRNGDWIAGLGIVGRRMLDQ